MAQLPFDPFRQLSQFRQEIDSLLNDFPIISREQLFGNVRIDIHETDDTVIAICDLPGIENKEDIEITITNNMLRIVGTVKRFGQGKEHRKERVIGRFERALSLPCSVSHEGTQASYKNGVLEVKMPKLANDQKKQNIDVEFN